jgi:hypothetical protein
MNMSGKFFVNVSANALSKSCVSAIVVSCQCSASYSLPSGCRKSTLCKNHTV